MASSPAPTHGMAEWFVRRRSKKYTTTRARQAQTSARTLVTSSPFCMPSEYPSACNKILIGLENPSIGAPCTSRAKMPCSAKLRPNSKSM